MEIILKTLRLKTKSGYKPSKIAHILQVSKQIICDTLAISRRPRKILDDAIANQVIGKVALTKIARCRKSPAYKIAHDEKEKKLFQSGQKGLRKNRKCIVISQERTQPVGMIEQGTLITTSVQLWRAKRTGSVGLSKRLSKPRFGNYIRRVNS